LAVVQRNPIARELLFLRFVVVVVVLFSLLYSLWTCALVYGGRVENGKEMEKEKLREEKREVN
jgi:hypothetical protein